MAFLPQRRISDRRPTAACSAFFALLAAAWLCSGGLIAESLFHSRNPFAFQTTKSTKHPHGSEVRLAARLLKMPSFELNLGAGHLFKAIRDRTDHYSDQDLVWVGHIDGEPLSRVTLAVRRGVVAGVIDRLSDLGKETWVINASPDGRQWIASVAPSPAGCVLPQNASTDNVGIPVSGSVPATYTSPSVVDLLVVYSPASRVANSGQANLEAMILAAVSDANSAYRNSGIHLQLNLVHMTEIAHVESPSVTMQDVLGRLANSLDGWYDEVPLLRDTYGADVVTLVSEDTGQSATGTSYIPWILGTVYPDLAYNVCQSGSLFSGVLVHEVAHNMGSAHNREDAGVPGAFPYSYGWRRCANDSLGFRTVMAYSCPAGTGSAPPINYFSNPNLSYLGAPLGVDFAADPDNASDNTRSINEAAPTVATFRNSTASPPGSPSGLTATAMAYNRIDLVWTDGSANEAGFELQRSPDGINWSSIAFLPLGFTSYSDRPLSAGTTAWYQVRAYNSGGFSPFTAIATATTAAIAAPPAAPSGFVATVRSGYRVDLLWVDNANNEDGFRLERSTDGLNFSPLANLDCDLSAFLDGTAFVNTVFTYRLTAFNSAGDSPSVLVSATVPAIPNAPTGLLAQIISGTQLRLTWIDNATNETGYTVFRSVNGGAFAIKAAPTINATTYNDTSVSIGNSYIYHVQARGFSGLSPVSNDAGGTVDLPSAPLNLTGTAVSSSQIDLTWMDTSNNESGFGIERSEDGVLFAPLADVGSGVTVYQDATVVVGPVYTYRVKATNGIGSSAYATTPSGISVTADPPMPPANPSALLASAVSAGQVNLTWVDNSDNELTFRIERATGEGAFSTLGTVGMNIINFSDTTVSPETTYNYRVIAVGAGGDSAPSNISGVVTPVLPPSAPSGLQVTAATSAQVDLSWTDTSPDETAFRMERALGAGAFVEIAVLGANVTSFSDSTVAPATTYSYRIRASNSGGDSEYATPVVVTTLPLPPIAPSGLASVAFSSSRVDLSWVDASANEDVFRVERALGNGTFAEVATLGPNVTVYSDTAVAPGSTYSYRVRASNSGGFSPYSAPSTVSTPILPPSAPSGLSALAVAPTQVNLSWADNSPDEAGFRIERALGSGSFVEIVTVAANSISYTDTTVSPATSYSYRVRSYNAGGVSPYSATASATTPLVPPAAPSNLLAVPISSSRINLTWTDGSSNESGFRIERATGAGAYSQIALVGANIVAFSDTSLSPATSYTYRIRATNSGGDSPFSNTSTAATLPLPPSAPSGISATVISATRINVAWIDNASNETGFRLERATGSGAFALIATLGANAISYADTNLSPVTRYSYRVRAYNSGGNSAYSPTVSATTPELIPLAPSNLSLTALSSSQIRLNWTDNSLVESGFKIERSNNGTSWTQVATVAANLVTFTNTGLSRNTWYYYRVRAYNASGNSAYSGTASIKTLK